ncbi:hypothetical protein DL771_009308 [Monosporascus sp. 5C6A]|nr:hypothetical protein DL771_009308 [Monosporascus sp. 5C6A]
MFAICALNLIKASIMLSIWALGRWQQRQKQEKDKEVLYTLGDAIASFMREPETRTEKMCLATNRDLIGRRSWKNRLVKAKPKANTEPRQLRKERKLWVAAASSRRWFILLFTTLLVQHEFSRMSTTRKPLRVSEPLGIQRSSYFISLPLRYGVPLYATAGLMH